MCSRGSIHIAWTNLPNESSTKATITTSRDASDMVNRGVITAPGTRATWPVLSIKQGLSFACMKPMVKVELGFAPNHFEKAMIEQTKHDLKERLHGHDLGRVKIVLKKRPGNQIAFQFLGEQDGVDKARRLLGIH